MIRLGKNAWQALLVPGNFRGLSVKVFFVNKSNFIRFVPASKFSWLFNQPPPNVPPPEIRP